jgi:hypothetical protein
MALHVRGVLDGEFAGERMRRLRATAEAMPGLRADVTPDGHRRWDAAWRASPLTRRRGSHRRRMVGPDALPPEAFTREAADRMLALP